MTRKYSSWLTLSLSAILVAGCRGDEPSDTADAAVPDAVVVTCADDRNIQDVQDISMPAGTPVALCGVVVTAVDRFGDRQGHVWVMEPGGGEYSGVMIYVDTDNTSVSDGIEVGDLVDITGVKDEFALNEDTSGRTLTEIVANGSGQLTITKVGDGVVPDPMLLDPRDLAASDDEAEKWEGVLVKFESVGVNSAPFNDTENGSMSLTGPFYARASLTPFDPNQIAVNDCLAETVGIVDYFFNYQLLPRSAADIVTGGAGCPPPEEGTELCGDGMDNDYDGFGDCDDFSCQATEPNCRPPGTVVEVQDGTIPENSAVTLTAVITGFQRDREHLWIMDPTGAAQYNGLYVYRGSNPGALPQNYEVGTVITVAGTVTEYFGLTELTNITAMQVVGAAPVEALRGVNYATLSDDNSNEPYEGVLVELQNIPVNEIDVDEYGTFTVGGQNPLRVGDWAYDFPSPQVDTCFATLTGIMHRFSTGVSLSPRSADDMVTGGTCP